MNAPIMAAKPKMIPKIPRTNGSASAGQVRVDQDDEADDDREEAR